MKTICPLGQFRRWRGVGESCQKHYQIERTARSFEHPANCNQANHATVSHEAMFKKPVLAIPADQARVNLEGLECFEIATKLGDRVAHHRGRLLLSCNSQDAGTRELIYVTNVGEREISTGVDVDVKIQVIWPNAQTNTGRRE